MNPILPGDLVFLMISQSLFIKVFSALRDCFRQRQIHQKQDSKPEFYIGYFGSKPWSRILYYQTWGSFPYTLCFCGNCGFSFESLHKRHVRKNCISEALSTEGEGFIPGNNYYSLTQMAI